MKPVKAFVFIILALLVSVGAIWAQEAEEVDKTVCLECHGDFKDIIELTKNYKTPGGEQINPHRYVPHNLVNDKTIFECTNCHNVHKVPPEEGDIVKAATNACFSCHHNETFEACSNCH